MTNLANLVKLADRDRAKRFEAEGVLHHIICRPVSGELLAHARRLVPDSEVSAPRPGDCYLVGVDGAGASLFHATWSEDASLLAFEGSAGIAAAQALRWAAREALFVRELPLLVQGPKWRACCVASLPSELAPQQLDGDSYGLALHLAAVSIATGVPLDTTVLALGSVVNGYVARVEGIAQKAAVIKAYAPSARLVVVASQQECEWKAVFDDSEIAVVGVDCVERAATYAFADVDWANVVQEAWATHEDVARALHSIYRHALSPKSPLLDWTALAITANALQSRLDRAEDLWRARFAESVAARHSGRTVSLPELGSDMLHSLPRPIRLQVLAHYVQDANDGVSKIRERIALAAPQVASPRERHAEDLVLVGALARGHAALREFGRAVDLCREAVAGWYELDELHNASHPLCEWLRLVGLQGNHGCLDEIRRDWLPLFRCEPRADESQAFIELALGRALVLTDDATAALNELALERSCWRNAPIHVLVSMHRWRANALDTIGDSHQAALARAAQRVEAERKDPDQYRVFVALAELDHALHHGETLDEALTKALAIPEIRERFRGLEEKNVATARAIVREYPY